MDEVRTRFAPSPTGYMHVGNLRTALYSYLLAKSQNGKFILRIEDTDKERYAENTLDTIYKTLKEANLIWDEGPDIGGGFGPYIQSERIGIYNEYAKKLVDSGHAYHCFCNKNRLEEIRALQKASGEVTKYDGNCRNFTKAQILEKLAAKIPYVIRQRIPTIGQTTFTDEIFGVITVENVTLEDQILIKADGMPTYNFANVVDDHTMRITHVIRGNEYLSSTPKYNLLYEAFGWNVPKYIHCGPVMKTATVKFSKRNGDASYEDLIEMGYLKEAILNYIALLGWSPKSEREIFSLKELIKEFNVNGISKSPAIFDIFKLNYINSHYIKSLTADEFWQKAYPFIKRAIKNENINTHLVASILQTRTEYLSNILQQIDFIDNLPDYEISLYTNKKMKTNKESSLEILKGVLPILEKTDDYSIENLRNILMMYTISKNVNNGFVLWPIRVALSGKQFTPGGAIEIAAILLKTETITRIKFGIKKLQAVN